MFSAYYCHQRDKSHENNLIPGLGSFYDEFHFLELLQLPYWTKVELALKYFYVIDNDFIVWAFGNTTTKTSENIFKRYYLSKVI